MISPTRPLFPPQIRCVGVFALSYLPDEARLAAGVRILEERFGVRVKVRMPPEPGPRRMAGFDDERAACFNDLVQDPEVDGLVAARGGYGATRVLERIDFAALKDSGKFVCGYSDTTALLLAAWKHGCTRLYHGPMATSSSDCPQEWEAFAELLGEDGYIVPPGQQAAVLKSGCVDGILVPMNFSMLQALLGTPWMPCLDNAILCLEDIGEPAHDIDRKLRQLRQCGILERLGGLLFGQFGECENDAWLPEIEREYGRFVKGPVAAGLPFGHLHPSIPLPLGACARVVCGQGEATVIWGKGLGVGNGNWAAPGTAADFPPRHTHVDRSGLQLRFD